MRTTQMKQITALSEIISRFLQIQKEKEGLLQVISEMKIQEVIRIQG